MTRTKKPKPALNPRPIKAWAVCVHGVPVPALVGTYRSGAILAYVRWAGEPWKKRGPAWRCLPVLISPIVKTNLKPKDDRKPTQT